MSEEQLYPVCSRPGCNQTLIPTWAQHPPGAACHNCRNRDLQAQCRDDLTMQRAAELAQRRGQGLMVVDLPSNQGGILTVESMLFAPPPPEEPATRYRWSVWCPDLLYPEKHAIELHAVDAPAAVRAWMVAEKVDRDQLIVHVRSEVGAQTRWMVSGGLCVELPEESEDE